ECFAIGKRAVVCQDTEMKGEIDIGSGTVLHPQCKIVAESGPIIIGSNNIIEENVTIINKQPTPLIIGDENVFEVGCYVEGSRIGNKNVVEAKARILGTTSLGDNCVIGAVCSTKRDEAILDNTVIYGDHHNRRIQTASGGQQSSLHARHLEYLREITLPTLHFFLGKSFLVLNHRGSDSAIEEASDVKFSPLITSILDTIVALTYQLLWVYPIFVLSFVLNAMWYQEIADRAYRLYHGRPPINSNRTYPRALKVIADEIYRALLFMNYLMVATIVYVIPVIGPIMSFMYFCWIYAYYSFEYKWINQGWSLEQRIGYFEERWSYFAGFGFMFTVITFFVDQFLSAGVFALLFPLYIIMANNALPMPRHNENARFSSLVPYRLRVFWVAEKLNDKIIGGLRSICLSIR
ncbi:19966_t:CDS:10, partial [Cetraspora pellucida]